MAYSQTQILRGRILTALDEGPCTSDHLHDRIKRCVSIRAVFEALRDPWFTPYAYAYRKAGSSGPLVWSLKDGVDIKTIAGIVLPSESLKTEERTTGYVEQVGTDQQEVQVMHVDPPNTQEFNQGKKMAKIVIREYIPAQEELAITISDEGIVSIPPFPADEIKVIIAALKGMEKPITSFRKEANSKSYTKRVANALTSLTAHLDSHGPQSLADLAEYLKSQRLHPPGPGLEVRVRKLLESDDRFDVDDMGHWSLKVSV